MRTIRAEWKAAAEARTAGVPVSLHLSDAIVWSRPCLSNKLTEDARKQKKYDYFLLTRLTDPDAAVIGEHLTEVTINRDTRAVLFSLNKTGSERLKQLTEKNKGRSLAIVLDGQVVFKATIQSAISSRGQITGKFTNQEIDRIAELMRAEIPKPK